MRRPCVVLASIFASVWFTSSAHALCSYNGQMYAKTTIAQEFRDSKWVVQAKVIAADNHWSDEDDSWTIYHLQVMTAYKGNPPLRVDVFTYRDSGGFYLDKGTSNNLGGKYLLFIDPVQAADHVPLQARRASEVNYSCGQSKEWTLVTDAEHHQLEALAGGKQVVHHESLPTDERFKPR